MAAAARLICFSSDLSDGGPGVRFEIDTLREPLPAFAVRYNGRVYAYVNRCRHIGVELDWLPGRFFDDSGLYLICATHGATYLPDDGRCVAGPCRGARLTPVAVAERAGAIYLEAETNA